MNQELFQEIYNRLETVFPAQWSAALFRCHYAGDSYSMKYYVDSGNGEYVDCFSLSGVNRAQILKAFLSVHQLLNPEREKLPPSSRWSALTLSIRADGAFRTEFDYANLSESSVDYAARWEKKYLRKAADGGA